MEDHRPIGQSWSSKIRGSVTVTGGPFTNGSTSVLRSLSVSSYAASKDCCRRSRPCDGLRQWEDLCDTVPRCCMDDLRKGSLQYANDTLEKAGNSYSAIELKPLAQMPYCVALPRMER
jgi:hypothetical protein